MKVIGKEIIFFLHHNGCHPIKTNFKGFCDEVEKVLILKSGLKSANISEESVKNISEEARKFSKACRKIWDRFKRFEEFSRNDFFTKEIEIQVTAYQISTAAVSQTPTTSSSSSAVKSKTSRKRAAKKDFELKSKRAKLAESAKIRSDFPPGAISIANIQNLKAAGESDAYYVSKKLVTDPAAAAKAKVAVKLENPGATF